MTKKQRAPVHESFPLDPGLQKEIESFLEAARSAEHILISSTLTSDGDSIGSQIGIYSLIQKLRPEDPPRISIVNESPVPHRYAFLKWTDKIQTFADWEKSQNAVDFDLGVTCDGGVERTGQVASLFENIPSTVLVDHHAVGSSRSYDAKILNLDSSSTCEIVFDLFEQAGLEVDAPTAEHLYVGIVFDTGFFKHSLTKPRTHYVASKLVETGIDFSAISDKAILERSFRGQLLLKRMLVNMESSAQGKLITSFWSHDDLNEILPKDGDQEGLINQLYYTEGVEAVALFVETKPGQVKVSFRSKGGVNVAEFARSLNSAGGGHVRAAGCSLEGDLSEVRKEVSEKLSKIL